MEQFYEEIKTGPKKDGINSTETYIPGKLCFQVCKIMSNGDALERVLEYL